MLSLLTGTELSAAEVARELGTTQANASYHLRVLLDAGLLVISGVDKVRGGRAKKYRHPWDSVPPESAASRTRPTDRAASVRAIADMIPRRFEHRDGTVPVLLTDAELWVTPETWAEVFELLTRASHLVHERALPPRTEGQGPGKVAC